MKTIAVVLLFVGLTASQQTHDWVQEEVGPATETQDGGSCAYTFIVPQENLPSHPHGSHSHLSEISEKLDNIQINLHQLQVSLNVESTYQQNGHTEKVYPEDCHHAYILNGSHLVEGVHFIQPKDYPEPFAVYCEVADDGIWNVIQRRQDGSVHFDNEWTTYKYGFGYVTGEHWLGNEKIFHLLRRGRYKLRVDLQEWDNNTGYAEYDFFQIGNEDAKYTLLVGDYSGNTLDSLSFHNGMAFTTKDQDNDAHSGCCTCISGYGGWWYNNCLHSNLNGMYLQNGGYSISGVRWAWKIGTYSYKRAVMKVEKVHP
ncbi:fibrinogen-like protein A [Glandiceps talaboti]